MTDDNEKRETAPNPKEVEGDDEASFFTKMRSDTLKKKIESVLRKDGVVKNLVSELKMPREIVNHLMSQIDETKQAALGVISREVRVFFENTNLSDELAKLLSQLSFEVSTRVRFVRNEPDERPKKRSREKVEEPNKAKPADDMAVPKDSSES